MPKPTKKSRRDMSEYEFNLALTNQQFTRKTLHRFYSYKEGTLHHRVYFAIVLERRVHYRKTIQAIIADRTFVEAQRKSASYAPTPTPNLSDHGPPYDDTV